MKDRKIILNAQSKSVEVKKGGGEKTEQVQWMTSNYKVAISTTIAVITLNVNGLNKKAKNRCQSG